MLLNTNPTEESKPASEEKSSRLQMWIHSPWKSVWNIYDRISDWCCKCTLLLGGGRGVGEVEWREMTGKHQEGEVAWAEREGENWEQRSRSRLLRSPGVGTGAYLL